MKLRIKTEEIEVEIEQAFDENNLNYDDGPNNLLKIVKEAIQKVAEESNQIIKTKYENKDFI